ncbi:MAG TPA: 2'-deoxycytidine 5'-triphosphate deaminase [Candidatus Methylomirabilis sp.]|nr:2'-deoxycytidine 5'-triphosphate deaminase [Candidatus Methylomirabilis sp.]
MANRPGALPFQTIRDILQAGYVTGASDAAIQPSSLDLTITDEVYRMRGSYLPRPGEPVKEIISRGSLYTATLNLPLERGGIYLIRLKESLKLPKTIHATVSNKSSSGRIDLRARLVADGLPRFDSVPDGYAGSLWIEVVPKSFPVRLHAGDRVNQIRFFYGNAKLNALEHQIAYDNHRLLRSIDGRHIPSNENIVQEGVTMTIDLLGADGPDGVIGWRSHPGAWNVLDTARYDHNPFDFFEPIARPRTGELTLTPGTFYVLSTKEKIVVPPHLAAEMANYDPSKGEFRSHFAGFFDPGFGWDADDAKRGTAAVLEVEAFGHECVLRDGQPICLMAFERMLSTPEKLYGQDMKSNYASQSGPRLAKWFSSPSAANPRATTTPSPIAKPTVDPAVEPQSPVWDDLGRFDLG